eukprot:8925501-Prorocentrum_lima.AAC.1
MLFESGALPSCASAPFLIVASAFLRLSQRLRFFTVLHRDGPAYGQRMAPQKACRSGPPLRGW